MNGNHQKAFKKKHPDTPSDKKPKLKVGCEKLIPHLMKHEDYVLHYRNLKFIYALGVKIN